MSPIFVRPVREQLEHDRLIRHLLPKYKRKHEVATNLGDEQLVPVKIGPTTYFPDLVLTDDARVAGIVEIETGESVNNLEAMYQWVPFSKARMPFHLYVPVQGYDAARRLIEANAAKITEVWTYRPANDGFDLVRMSAEAPVAPRTAPRSKSAPAVKGKAAPAKPAPKAAKAAKPARSSKPTRSAKPVKRAAKPARPVSKPAKSKSSKPAVKKAKKGSAARRGR